MGKEVILKVENLSKQYRLGTIGTGTISHDLNRFFAKIRGKEDPFLKVGEANDRSVKGNSNYVWALKDINFEVEKGEVLGIIGKNGAGKSTLLKILSKVTGPTTGTIKSNGRIASLLEVGTGFHPEMTGRENIFLNGAILGMTKNEIRSKLDEIIDFSGCERYIDTPVKRYSSGMKVRLAFAVAAFLEPDILVVDEVLAVGDLEFQKKAIGKMQNISKGDGRTVLFVSHNMAAVKKMCDKVIVLDKGQVLLNDLTDTGIDYYKKISSDINHNKEIHNNINNSLIVENYKIYSNNSIKNSGESILLGEKLKISIRMSINKFIDDLTVSFDIFDFSGQLISHLINDDDDFKLKDLKEGSKIDIEINTEALNLTPGLYYLNMWLGNNHVSAYYTIKNMLIFDIEQGDYTKRTRAIPSHSKVYIHSKWKKNNHESKF